MHLDPPIIGIHCGHLYLRKSSKIVATWCQMSSLKCTKFVFRWGEPFWGAYIYNALPEPYSFASGKTLLTYLLLIQWSGCCIAVKICNQPLIICSTDRKFLQNPHLKALQKTAFIVPRISSVTKPPQSGIAAIPDWGGFVELQQGLGHAIVPININRCMGHVLRHDGLLRDNY